MPSADNNASDDGVNTTVNVPLLHLEGDDLLADRVAAAGQELIGRLGWRPERAAVSRRRGGRTEAWLVGTAQERLLVAPPLQELLGEVEAHTYRASLLGARGDAPLAPGAVLVVPFAAPRSELAELDAYYEDEHVPLLLAIPGWQRVWRWALEPLDAGTLTRLAFHDLREPAIFSGPQVRATTETAWYQRLIQREWFRQGAPGAGRYLSL